MSWLVDVDICPNWSVVKLGGFGGLPQQTNLYKNKMITTGISSDQ